uniref:Uncharacterized protein n=1 Tax=Oryza brachyantha TaxID=4533 RepID=J3LVZ7_ORYBR
MGNGETRNLACPYSTYPGKGRRDGVWTGNRGVTKASPASGSTKAQEGTARLGVKEGVKPEVCITFTNHELIRLDRFVLRNSPGYEADELRFTRRADRPQATLHCANYWGPPYSKEKLRVTGFIDRLCSATHSDSSSVIRWRSATADTATVISVTALSVKTRF